MQDPEVERARADFKQAQQRILTILQRQERALEMSRFQREAFDRRWAEHAQRIQRIRATGQRRLHDLDIRNHVLLQLAQRSLWRRVQSWLCGGP